MSVLTGRLIAILLLLGQVLVGGVRGQVLCIPLGACEQHATVNHTTECDHHGCSHIHAPADHQGPAEEHQRHHQHSPFDAPASDPLHMHAPCACHLHVPLPDRQPLPGTTDRSAGEQRLSSPVGQAMLAESVPDLGAEHSIVPPPRLCEWAGRAQTCALKTTRLRL